MARFHVTYRLSGEATRTIEAENLEAAKQDVDDEIYTEGFEIEADETEVESVSVKELHPVVRNGKQMWTTYVRDGDIRGHEEAA